MFTFDKRLLDLPLFCCYYYYCVLFEHKDEKRKLLLVRYETDWGKWGNFIQVALVSRFVL